MSISFPNSQYQTQVSYPTQTGVQTTRGIRSQIKQDVQSLSSDLQSGDLSGAQKAFADIQKVLQSSGAIGAANNTSTGSTTSNTSTTSSNPLVNDFQALGQALSSGDLAGAQKDFAQLQTDASAQASSAQDTSGTGRVGGHHRHHGGPPPPPPPDTDSDSDSSSTDNGTTIGLRSVTSALATTNSASSQSSFAVQAYQSIAFASSNTSTDPISLNPTQSFSYSA